MRTRGLRSKFSVTGSIVPFCLLVSIVAFGPRALFAQSVFRPAIGMTLRGVTDGVVERGEPMRVNVQLRLDDSETKEGTVVLAPAGGTWVDAVKVELLDAEGKPTGIQAQSFGAPDKTAATLNRKLIAGGPWLFKSGATSTLAPGAYALRARLVINSATPGSNGWTGEVFSEDIPFEIVAPSDTPERRAQKALSVAQEAILDNRLQDAAAGLDTLLAEQRDNVQAWTLRAVVAERAGNILGALQCVNEGQTHYAALNIDEPNFELHAIMERLMTALEEAKKPEVVSAPEGDWSWPPEELLSAQEAGQPPEDTGGPAATPPAGQTSTQAPAQTSAKAEPIREQEKTSPLSVPAAPVAEATVVPAAEAVESDYLADPRGQWAVAATASSEYGKDRYNAAQATGAPNVASYSDNPNAWCPSGASYHEEWLDLEFARPVRATELRVRQSYTPGTLAKVEAFAADGRGQVLWEGTDPNTYPKGQISWFVLRFPPPEFAVQRVKLTLSIARVPGWKQIDAVQLVGEAP